MGVFIRSDMNALIHVRFSSRRSYIGSTKAFLLCAEIGNNFIGYLMDPIIALDNLIKVSKYRSFSGGVFGKEL